MTVPAPVYGPGIYFGLPFDEYCRIPAMNASRLKLELVSPMDAWARSPKNPVYEDIDDETKAKNDGRIYHKLILEGKEEFEKVYAPQWEDNPEDKNLLRKAEDIKYALSKMGQPVTFNTKAEGIARLLLVSPEARGRITDVMAADHRAKFPGREFVSAKLIREVELHNHVIKYNPELRKWLMGGQPEVTIIWRDHEYGLLFKIRVDYLKLAFATDLKSFANSKMKRVKFAIMDAIASYKYHIQGSLYLRGMGAAKYLAEGGMVFNFVKMDDGKAIFETALPDDLKRWVDAFPKYPAESFNFIFIQKGPAPVAKGFWMKRDSALDRQGTALIQDAVKSHLQAVKNFGDDPPLDLMPAEELQMDELPAYINQL